MRNNKQPPKKETRLINDNEISVTVAFVDYSPKTLLNYLIKNIAEKELSVMEKVIQAYPVYQEELEILASILQDYDNDIEDVLAYTNSFKINVEEVEIENEEEGVCGGIKN